MNVKIVGKHSFTFNSFDNGGEQLTLVTNAYDNGDNNPPSSVYYNQFLTLHSNCNSVTLNLYSALFTPENLRKLADELEALVNKKSG